MTINPVVPLPWIETPLVYSAALSKIAGCRILLKLENIQPSGSFKSRGIGNLVRKAVLSSPSNTPLHFYCSSGGNAGLACVRAASDLGYGSTVIVPLSCNPMMISKIQSVGGQVIQHGSTWFEADKYLREECLVKDNENGVYVPPFDHKDVWEGAETLIEEVERQGGLPDAIVASVGGGGLMIGLCQGIQKTSHPDRQQQTKVIAVETEGADSLNASVKAGELVTIPGITSIATSLGCVRVASEAFKWSQEKHVKSVVVTDKEAIEASLRFLDDERILAEPACGATLALVYTGRLKEALGGQLVDDQGKEKEVVIVVCGGSNISLEMLQAYKEKFGIQYPR